MWLWRTGAVSTPWYNGNRALARRPRRATPWCRGQVSIRGVRKRNLVTYKIETRGAGLAVSIELLPDQLNVNFGGCGLVIELAAHHPRFGSNPRAFEDWQQRCLDTVRGVLTSDLRIETRSLGGAVRGGWIWRREGEKWVRCGGGGDILMLFGEKWVTEYRDWLAR
jgi:hypothetical protein